MSQWVLKLSKLCNLRCAYCYEWDELGDGRRISQKLWANVVSAIVANHDREVGRRGSAQTTVILHGGEPLATPLGYLEDCLDHLRHAIGDRRGFHLAMQSNLYRLTEGQLALLRKHRIELGLSFDLVGGVRRSVTGRETEATVIRNMDRLRDAGVPFGAIAVLARHTAPRLEEVYDFFAARGVPFRVLPLSAGPASRPEELFALPTAEIVLALGRFFVHWIQTGRRVRVAPLHQYLEVAVRKLLGIAPPLWSRRAHGESVVVVNTDGKLYRMDDLYEDEALLGDLATDTLEAIYASTRYRLTLARDEAESDRVCGDCDYRGACSGIPLFASKHGELAEGRCSIAYPMHRFVERYVTELGFTREELAELVGLSAAELHDVA